MTPALGLLVSSNDISTSAFSAKYKAIFSALEPKPEANRAIRFKIVCQLGRSVNRLVSLIVRDSLTNPIGLVSQNYNFYLFLGIVN